MAAQVIVTHKWAKVVDQGEAGVEVIDTTSKSGWWSGLSPFILGPVELYSGVGSAMNVENAWQFSKVYSEDTDDVGDPTAKYWAWARLGWADSVPHRYPKGKGRVPEYSLWDGQRLGYVDARKRIYVPLYAEAVQRMNCWQTLLDIYRDSRRLYLRDWDGWSMEKYNMATLADVLNNPCRKMGHAFVLAMLLTGDSALRQCAMR